MYEIFPNYNQDLMIFVVSQTYVTDHHYYECLYEQTLITQLFFPVCEPPVDST